MAAAMLVLISIPLGLFVYYKVRQIIVRHEMKEKLGHAQLQTIELHESDVHWYEEGREILVNGKLFDVLSQQKVAGTHNVRFFGLFDEAETELEYKTGRLIREKEKNDDSQKLIVQAVWLFNSPIQRPESLATLFADHSKKYTSLITARIPLVDIAIPVPPPKAC